MSQEYFGIKRISGRRYKVVGKSGMLYTEGGYQWCKDYIDENYPAIMAHEEADESTQGLLRLQEQGKWMTADRGYQHE